jgi:hypothetical protein
MILTAATGPYFAKNMPRLSSDIAVGRFDYDPDQHPSTTHPREHSRRIDYSSNTTNQHTAKPLIRGILTSGSPKSCDPLAFSHATRVEQVRYTRPTRHYGYVMICRYEPARADTELPSSTLAKRGCQGPRERNGNAQMAEENVLFATIPNFSSRFCCSLLTPSKSVRRPLANRERCPAPRTA